MVDAVEHKLADLRNIVDPLHDIKPPVVSVEYKHHGYTVFGSCSKQSGVYVLGFHPTLLNELGQRYIDEVVVHEYAHACVMHYVGKISRGRVVLPHGREFAHYCQLLGIKSSTTHIADGTQFQASQYHTYSCHCRDHKLRWRYHDQIQQGIMEFTCSKYQQALVLKNP